VTGQWEPEVGPGESLDSQIARWRGYVQRHRVISAADADELEGHLRDQASDLQDAGLSGDEAFLVAVRRLGSLDEVSREFGREHSARLWKQLVLSDEAEATGGWARHRELVVVLGLGVGAGLSVLAPLLLGPEGLESGAFYPLNVGLLVLPFLAAYFAWKRQMRPRVAVAMLVPPFVVGALIANLYPVEAGGSTEVLLAIHLLVALWFVVGVAYVGGDWRSHERRMDFIRFTGEWAIYYTLLALGGGVLVALTIAGFSAIGQDIAQVIAEWVLPVCAAGAVLVAAWLVEAKQSVVENLAPVLTKVFTPLATLMLLAYLVAILATGDLVEADRELLILADLILVLVLGLLLYAVSARDPHLPANPFDALQLVMVVTALAIDVLMLAAMLGRIAEFGASPNKVAALGLNLLLLVNLAWSARLLAGLWRGAPFTRLERWQTGYLPLFGLWAATVAVVLPPVFSWQ
jgi:hypothetical protein